MHKMFLLLILAACTSAPAAGTKDMKKTATAATAYELKVNESQLIWKGAHVVGSGHEGTLQFLSGRVATSPDGVIQSGSFVLDMNSISNTDQKFAESRKDLNEHLKSDDFFAVAKFPKAYFTITGVTPLGSPGQYQVTGNLQLRGVTNAISFPASISTHGNTLRAEAAVTIDRTKWGITFESATVLNMLKDGLISDKIHIAMKLVFQQAC